MSFDIKRLKEERAQIHAAQRALWEKAEGEKRSLNTEEKAADAKADADFAGLSERIAKLEALEARDAKLLEGAMQRGEVTPPSNGAPALNDETRALALQGWMRAQSEMEVTERHAEAMRAVGINPARQYLDIKLRDNQGYREFRREVRAGMSTTDNVGGYTIPTGFVNNFEVALLQFGGLRAVADVLRTDTGNDLPWPTGNDTGNKGVLLAEETTIGNTVNPTIGVKIFGAYKMSSKLIQVSPELLQDTAFDMASQIGAWLGERIGRIESDYYTTGTGSSQPTGLLAASGGTALGVTTASPTAITTDEILDLIHSVDPAYRNGAAFSMHDGVVKYLRKLKDGDGNYIWVPGLQSGQMDRLLGYTIAVNQSMQSSVASNTKTMVFGQLKKFKIRDVSQIRLRRLVERYADTDQEGFVAFHRTDSGLLDAGTHPVSHMLQAT